MEKAFPLEERSISQIYLEEGGETKTYQIPVYQRNYAWGEGEIATLIKDVHDSFKSKKDIYYIGTLVTYKRGDNKYEVIDGQQRLTTIYIILKAMGVQNFRNKLTYSARKISASTIQKLDHYPDLGDEVDKGIRNGYEFAKKALKAIVEQKEWLDFKQYFLQYVHIIHYRVPKDVDLNHYFEVMNSRGEQLEKHEIVKSVLCKPLSDEERATFCRVWEACSEMNVYIQQVFPKVFRDDPTKLGVSGFEDIPQQHKSEGKKSIKELLESPAIGMGKTSGTEKNDKFQPIIDFPNFLLIVLKIMRLGNADFKPADFVLDDKELVKEFDKALQNYADDQAKAEFAREFAVHLLNAKFFLDNYIVHHSMEDKELLGNNPWRLQYYHTNSNKPESLAKEQNVQIELVHLLSMFEVTFTAKQRKNYLLYCLKYLMECERFNEEDYLKFLRALAGRYFFGVYCASSGNQPAPNAFDSVLLHDGELNVKVDPTEDDRETGKSKFKQKGIMDIPLFVFNYMDYILWKEYADSVRGKEFNEESQHRKQFFKKLGCSDFGLKVFDNFYFSRTRKSLEHYYPQAKAGEGKDLSVEDINCFGNFAMIGAEANSSGSNWDPKTKLEHYSDAKSDQVSVASLKFKIMMQRCKDNYTSMLNGELKRNAGMEWNAKDIEEHQQKMIELLFP